MATPAVYSLGYPRCHIRFGYLTSQEERGWIRPKHRLFGIHPTAPPQGWNGHRAPHTGPKVLGVRRDGAVRCPTGVLRPRVSGPSPIPCSAGIPEVVGRTRHLGLLQRYTGRNQCSTRMLKKTKKIAPFSCLYAQAKASSCLYAQAKAYYYYSCC